MTNLPFPETGAIKCIWGTDNKDPKLTPFEAVFDRICDFLSKSHTDNLVICITGDLVHDNLIAGAPCNELFYTIIQKLANIAPIHIITDNQASVNPLDSCMSGLQQYDNVAFIKDIAGNVYFGIVAIQDVGNTSGRVTDLPHAIKIGDVYPGYDCPI